MLSEKRYWCALITFLCVLTVHQWKDWACLYDLQLKYEHNWHFCWSKGANYCRAELERSFSCNNNAAPKALITIIQSGLYRRGIKCTFAHSSIPGMFIILQWLQFILGHYGLEKLCEVFFWTNQIFSSRCCTQLCGLGRGVKKLGMFKARTHPLNIFPRLCWRDQKVYWVWAVKVRGQFFPKERFLLSPQGMRHKDSKRVRNQKCSDLCQAEDFKPCTSQVPEQSGIVLREQRWSLYQNKQLFWDEMRSEETFNHGHNSKFLRDTGFGPVHKTSSKIVIKSNFSPHVQGSQNRLAAFLDSRDPPPPREGQHPLHHHQALLGMSQTLTDNDTS